MARREKEPIERVHLHLYSRDIERLKLYFGNRLPLNRAVRTIVRDRLDKIEAKIIKQRDLETVDDDAPIGTESNVLGDAL